MFKRPVCNHVKVMGSTSGADRVHHAVCRVVQRGSSAVKFDRVEIT